MDKFGGNVDMPKELFNIMKTSVKIIWDKREYFNFTFSSKGELEDLVEYLAEIYNFISHDVEYKIGIVLFTVLGAKLDDLMEKNKSLTEEAIRVLENVSLEEMKNFSLKSGEENKISNTVLYMAQAFVVRSRVKDSEVLYREYRDHFIGWLEGVRDMHMYLQENEEKSFSEYGQIRVRDFGAKMVIWMVVKISKIYEKTEGEDENFVKFSDLLCEHLWVTNDFMSLDKPNSIDLKIYQSMIDFSGFSVEEIKEYLGTLLTKIESKLKNFAGIDTQVRDLLKNWILVCFKAQSNSKRYGKPQDKNKDKDQA